jgi:hypothetical protein
VNLSSTDCLKIDLACQYFHMIWCSAILIIEYFIILYLYLGISALAGFKSPTWIKGGKLCFFIFIT